MTTTPMAPVTTEAVAFYEAARPLAEQLADMARVAGSGAGGAGGDGGVRRLHGPGDQG
jgi:hypothetical protein